MSRSPFIIENGILTQYQGPGGHVVIPAGVKQIGNYAFSECYDLQSVQIPEGITEIEEYAFFHCDSLTGVDIPGTVKQIGPNAFACCWKLAHVRLEEGVQSLGKSSFMNCFALSQVTLPKTLNFFHAGTFMGHRSLEIHIDPDNPWYCTRDRMVFSKDMKRLVFAPKNLTQAVLPEGLEVVEDLAFQGCFDLVDVTFPDSLTQIGKMAFQGCSLHSVSLPEGLETIEEFAFSGCEALTDFHVPARAFIGEQAFEFCDLRLIAPQVLPSRLSPEAKPLFVEGFADAYCNRDAIDPDIQAAYLKYIRHQRKVLYQNALRHEPLLVLMMEEKIIPRLDIQPLLERAKQQGNEKARAMLLQYRPLK